MYNVGTQYFAGKGVDLNMEKAAEYFEKAANLGFELAQVRYAYRRHQSILIQEKLSDIRQEKYRMYWQVIGWPADS